MNRYITRNSKKARGRLNMWIGVYPPVYNEQTGMWELPKFCMGTTEKTSVPRFIRRWIGSILPYGRCMSLKAELVSFTTDN